MSRDGNWPIVLNTSIAVWPAAGGQECGTRTGQAGMHRERRTRGRNGRTGATTEREGREVRVQICDAARRGTRYKDHDNAARAYISLVSRRILFGFRSIRPVFRRISPINPVFLGGNWAADIAIINDS